MADRHRYGKVIEDMENEVLHKKDPCPKTVSNACRLQNVWQNNY